MADQGKAVAAGSIAIGGILLWSAINNKHALDTTRNLVRGKPTQPGSEMVTVPNIGTTQIGGGDTGLPFGTVGTTTPKGSGNAANKAIGKLMASAYGWGSGAEWDALNYGWGTLESGWSNDVYYGGTHGGPFQPGAAYGIPQARGHGPNGAPYPAGNSGNPPGAGGISNPAAQIAWGLAYIKHTYGSPLNVPGWTGGSYSGY